MGDDALLGQTIGSYKITQLINAEGMGRVYKAVQPSIGARVAVKVLSSDLGQNPELVERFFAEARAVNIIRHEQIINIIDLASFPDGRPFIVMEFLEGAPLSGIMRHYGALPLGSFAQLVVEVLGALQAAHDRNIIHRDLKPPNIFVSPQGRPKVLDFGIAKLDPGLGGHTSATSPGQIMGTPAYMAPEQALARPVDARTDIYSMGIILYEGVTGTVPFKSDSMFGVLHQHLEATPRAPRELRTDCPEGYEHVIQRALAKDPARRFQTARDMANALAVVAQSLPPDSWVPLTPPNSLQQAAGMGTPPIRISGSVSPHITPAASPIAPTVHALPRPVDPKPKRKPWVVIGGIVGAITAAAVAIALTRDNEPTAKEPIATPVVAPDAKRAEPLAGAPPEIHVTRANDGFLVNLGFAQAPTEISVKLPGADWKSNEGATWIELPGDAPRSTIGVKYRVGDAWFGPFELVFDPDEVAVREAREALAAFPRWVEIRPRDRKLVVTFDFLRKQGAGIEGIRFGIDGEPDETLGPDETKREIPASARFVRLQVYFRDQSRSEVKQFDVPGTGGTTPEGVDRDAIHTGVPECDSLFTAMAACYRKAVPADAYAQAYDGLSQSAGAIRESLSSGTTAAEAASTCRAMRSRYREVGKQHGCEDL
jgi:serine/threonine protein kinase